MPQKSIAAHNRTPSEVVNPKYFIFFSKKKKRERERERENFEIRAEKGRCHNFYAKSDVRIIKAGK